MKTMKNFLSMAALTLMGAMMTGCSSDDNFANPQQPENKSNVVTLTTTVGLDGGATTRALTETGVKTFAVDDQIAVIYTKNGGTVTKAVSEKLISTDIASGSKSATFTVTLDDPDKTKNVTYIYPAAMAGETGVDLTKLNTQEGTFEALQSKYDLCTKSGAWDAGNLPSLTLENQLAILAITLKDDAATPAEITSSITSLTIGDGTNKYSVTRSAASGPIYVAIRPVASANIDITANDGSQCYNKSLTGKTYAKDNGYNVSWKMPEALISNANTLDYGMVVCAAGHLHLAKTAVPAGCTAVGILGKVTETGHGLILALQDARYQSWNTINGWTSVTTYAGTTLKVLPDADALGDYLTSYTALGETAVSNWAVAQQSDYAAIFTNLGSTTGGSFGKTYDDNVNAYITTGGAAMSGSYWSATEATEYGMGETHVMYFNNSSWGFALKQGGYWNIRPVLGFGGEAEEQAAPTLAQTMNTANMTVKVNYNYGFYDKENYCQFLSNGDGTYTFQNGSGFAGGDNRAKALVVEDGKLVFKQNFNETIDDSWGSSGYSVTFDTSNNTYSEWRSEQAAGGVNAYFISVAVNGTTIDVTHE